MSLKIKSIKWANCTLPALVKGNLLMVVQAVVNAFNWRFVQYEESTYKLIIRNAQCQMCIYLSTMTVQTSLDHPVHGKTQLTRKGLTNKEFTELLKNPRAHTTKGYYKKKK